MNRKDSRPLGRNLLFGTAFVAAASLAYAAEGSSGARERYLLERATCTSGQSHQPRDVCLREVGAAYEEARRGVLGHEDPDRLAANAVARCASRPPDQKEMCERMARGEGMVTGSVEDGGFVRELHEIVTPVDNRENAPGVQR